jgi:hypothetical protein
MERLSARHSAGSDREEEPKQHRAAQYGRNGLNGPCWRFVADRCRGSVSLDAAYLGFAEGNYEAMIKSISKIADAALERIVAGGRAQAGCPTEYYWEQTCYGADACPSTYTAQWRWVITTSCTAKRTSTFRCC